MRDGESETRRAGHPRKGEVVNWVSLWMTEAQHHWGLSKELWRVFLRVVPTKEGRLGWAWVGWVVLQGYEGTWSRESGRCFRHWRWGVEPPSTTAKR